MESEREDFKNSQPIYIAKNEEACSEDIKGMSRWLFAQLCQTLCDRIDYSIPGSSIHGIF